MFKIMPFVVCFLSLITGVWDAVGTPPPPVSDFISPTAYENLYPLMNNKMRTNLNPGVTPSQTQNPIGTLIRTSDQSTSGRRVVSRGASTARSGVSAGGGAPTPKTNTARAGVAPTGGGKSANQGAARRVTSRAAVSQNVPARGGGRGDNSYLSQLDTPTAITNSTTESISSDRCLADYTQCMNGYCEREKTSYNRCYCSAKLAQIDAEYQPAIDELIKQILSLKGGNHWTDEEMKKYWDDIIGKHTGDNSWTNLENALDINWADTESRVRGQKAFTTGHEYCAQHLRGCFYMAANMRDAYRSEIARDCAAYKTSLQKIKNVAESIVESYSE